MTESCGCCEGIAPLTPLATANRPGLDAIAYRVGTHSTFLETMEARLFASGLPILSGPTTRATTDPAIALLDAWATVADVLTFYQERVANEGYLRTATERRSILELARLVGYTLRPGVAASVYLAFTLEDGYDLKIPVGTRSQSLPGPGELPQSFETVETLEASADWNTLTPRRSQPQFLRPQQDAQTERLYLKGITTNLGPNDPILIDFGQRRAFFRVQAVEPDPAAGRTLVTLTLVASEIVDEFQAIEEQLSPRNSEQKVTLAPDVSANQTGPPTEDGKTPLAKLEELLGPLTKPPSEQPANALRLSRSLKQSFDPSSDAVAQLLAALRPDVRHTLYQAWEQIATEPSVIKVYGLRVTAAPFGQNAPLKPVTGQNGGIIGHEEWTLERATSIVAGTFGIDVKIGQEGEHSYTWLPSRWWRPLAWIAAVLGAVLVFLILFFDRPGAAGGSLIATVITVVIVIFAAIVLSLVVRDRRAGRVERQQLKWLALAAILTASLFVGELLNLDRLVGGTFWNLLDAATITILYAATVGVALLRCHLWIQITVTLDDESRVWGPQGLANGTFELAFTQSEETVVGTISNVKCDRFILELEFRNQRTVVMIRDRVDGGAIKTGAGEERPLATQIIVDIRGSDEFEVSSDGSDSTTVTVGLDEFEDRHIVVSGEIRERLTEPTETEDIVSLDASYRQILPHSWIVLERPDAVSGIPKTVITHVKELREGSRADYGMTAKGSQITLRQRWLNLDQDTFAVIRGTSVHAQSELLELAEAPLEMVDENGVVKVEPICGKRIELDALYDGLESGRWLLLTGEREDLPGVIASELVMLAGVEQGVQQVTLTTEDLQQRQVGEVRLVSIAGRGSSGPGGFDLTISARLLPDGSAVGHAQLVGGATGDVMQLVPPSGTRDFWCVNVKRTDTDPTLGDQRINWYIHDIGDGITSFDEIAFVSGIGVNCENNPAPPSWGAWTPLTEGDFKALEDLPGDKVHSSLVLANDLAHCYKRETVTIYGNVVRATHGETRTEVLGSGDGSKALQRFTLKQSPLTYVAATTPTGSEAVLNVSVDAVRWHEAKSLYELKPTDRRFVTSTDDQDNTTVIFGDGEHSARLPTGVENVRAVYRTGIGKVGNVVAEQISQLATRPLGLKGVINPLPATGGADRESRDQARRNTPVALMALDRLVSVKDYQDFARAFAGISKASATYLSDAHRQLVHLTIAADDDIPISSDSDLYRNLVQALQQFGHPHQPLRVEVRELILLIISAKVRVLPDHQWETVGPKVRAVLLDAFSFERRELGQDAMLSEVISTIQRVPGVAYVDVDTFGAIPEKKDPEMETTTDAVKPTDSTTAERHPILPTEIAEEIRNLVESEDQPLQRVLVELAGTNGGPIHPAQLAFLTPRVPDTLILEEITT